MDRLKLRHLRLIDAIVEARSLSAAAATLNITQPAASKGLREIEELLGLPLFVRSARGLTLTMFGRSLVAHGKTIQSEVRHITEELEAVADGNAGEVRVGAMLVSLPWLLPAALRLMRERAGHAPVRIIEGVQDVLVQELRSGAVDMIVGRLAPIDTRERLTQEVLLHEPMVVVAGARHPLTRQAAVSYADLAACRWILPPADSVVHSSVLQLFAQHGLANPEPFVETTSYLMSRTLMIEQEAIAALPLTVVRRDIDRGDLAMLPVRFPHEPLAVGVVTVAERRLSPAASQLMFCLREAAKGLNDGTASDTPAALPSARRIPKRRS
jgi:DNA-binding transcriptional LysR family regulator